MGQTTKCEQYGNNQRSISLQKLFLKESETIRNFKNLVERKIEEFGKYTSDLFRVSALEKLVEKNKTYELHFYGKNKRKLKNVSIFTYVYNDNIQCGSNTTD